MVDVLSSSLDTHIFTSCFTTHHLNAHQVTIKLPTFSYCTHSAHEACWPTITLGDKEMQGERYSTGEKWEVKLEMRVPCSCCYQWSGQQKGWVFCFQMEFLSFPLPEQQLPCWKHWCFPKTHQEDWFFMVVVCVTRYKRVVTISSSSNFLSYLTRPLGPSHGHIVILTCPNWTVYLILES